MKQYTFQVTTFDGRENTRFNQMAYDIDTAWKDAINWCIAIGVLPSMLRLTLTDIQ